MKKVIGLITALILIVSIFATGCTSSTPTPTPTAPTSLPAIQSTLTSLQETVNTLSASVTALQTKVDGISGGDTTALQTEIATLNAQIITLTDRITALEAGKVINEEGEVTTPTTWTPVRWRYDVEMEYKALTESMVTYVGTGTNVTADLNEIPDGISAVIEDVDPRTIKEEDLYDIELVILNRNDDWEVTLEDVSFVLTLQSNDYAYLDEDMTFLDSDSSPYLDWEASFIVREREGEDVTRRVEFESDELNSIKIDDNDSETLNLVLELYYA